MEDVAVESTEVPAAVEAPAADGEEEVVAEEENPAMPTEESAETGTAAAPAEGSAVETTEVPVAVEDPATEVAVGTEAETQEAEVPAQDAAGADGHGHRGQKDWDSLPEGPA